MTGHEEALALGLIRADAPVQSNMTTSEVHLHLAEVCNDFFGRGNPLLQQWDPANHPGSTILDLLTLVWFTANPDGPWQAYVAIMKHGGDEALDKRAGQQVAWH